MTTGNILSGGTPPPGGPPPPADGSSESSGAGGAGGSAGGGSGRVRAPVDPERDLACCRLPLTDMGRAERWRIRFGADFRFCNVLGWFAWDGRRWKLLSEEKDSVPAEIIRSLMVTVRAIRNEAALLAASGYEAPVGMTAKELARLEMWADAHKTSSFEFYSAAIRREMGDEADTWVRWVEELEIGDVLLGGSALHSQKVAAWAKASESGGTVAATLKWIKGFDDVVIAPEVLDRDPMAINVLNGTLRMVRQAEKRSSAEIEAGKSQWHMAGWKIRRDPHRREDMITKLAPVKYAPNARCGTYEGFFERVQPDPHMRRFLEQWGGYSLTGDTTEHKLVFFHGEGRNGKGTWLEALAWLAGDYASSIGIESLTDSGGQRRGDQATPDLAALPGVRMLRFSEPQVGMKFNDGLIKQLTGGDPVKARHLQKGFFEFFPDFKLTGSGNTRPVVKDVSHGMWARLQLVPWDEVIPEAEIDGELPAKLKGEASGILNRLLAGLIDWRAHGLIVPEQVKEATRAYRDASDQLGRFLAECCEVGDDPLRVRVSATELWDVFSAWVDATGSAEWKRNGFVKAMEDRKFKRKTSNGVWWEKVQLRAGVTLEAVKSGAWAPVPDTREPDLPPDDGAFDDDDRWR